MNKSEIIKEYTTFVKKFKLTLNDVQLGAGGACLMFGVRDETADMDIGLKQNVYNKLLKSGQYKSHVFNGTTVIEYNKYIDLHPEIPGETVTIEGVCCWSPQRVLDFKLMLNRPKDQKDILALKKYIKSMKMCHGFKRIDTTEEIIKIYKPQYYGLSHIRTGNEYKGVILIDTDDTFVAVLQCNIKQNEIQAIDINPKYRRQGIATSLLNLAFREFHCNKLTVRKTNTAAVNLYLKHGYKIVKEAGIMYYMERPLPSTESLQPTYAMW